MTIHQVVSVFDGALQAFVRPFTVPAVGVAMRSFMDEAAKGDSDIAKHPGDYELHHLGTFEDTTGRFTPVDSDVPSVCILRGVDCVRKAE